MKHLTMLMVLAGASVATTATAQMTLPQQRMFEAMRDVDSLNRAMESAKDAAKRDQSDQQSESRHDWRLIVVVGAVCWYIRPRRRPSGRTEPMSRIAGAVVPIALWMAAGARTVEAQIAIPHFAVGGGFVTGVYVVNTANRPAGYSITFRDDTGKAVALSFSGMGTRSTLSDTLPANGTRYYEGDSPTGSLLSGSGMIAADLGISVQAMFRRRGLALDYSEAAVPTSTGATNLTIPFDDTFSVENRAQIYTGMGLVNMDSQQPARVSCMARDDQGNAIANAVNIPGLAPLGHWAGFDFPALLNKRGTLNCVSNTKIGVVALRFVGNSMSSLPVIDSRSAAEGGRRTLPHFAAGGGFKTAFYVVNSGTRAASYTLRFYDDHGAPVSLSFAGSGSRSSLTDLLPVNGAKYFEADSPTGDLLAGWVNVARDPFITVQAVFMRRGTAGEYSEAAIPSSSEMTRFTIPFDDTVFAESGSQIYTGIALANADARTAHVRCTATDAEGVVIPNALSMADMPPGGHWAAVDIPALLGKRGALACTSDVAVAAIALRFLGNAMSSLPIIIPDPNAGGNTGLPPAPQAGASEYRDAKFSFQYPSTLSLVSKGSDPSHPRFTLIRLASADGSQFMEIRYANHQPGEEGWAAETAQLIGEFNRTQAHAFFEDWSYPVETSESGAVYTELWTNNLRNKNIEVIGTGIWAHSDYACIIFGYDRSRASRSARDTVFRTITFASAPTLLGRWKGRDRELWFNPGGTVDMTLGVGNENDYHTTGRYTATNNNLDISFQYYGVPQTWNCGYSATLGWLTMDCGAAGAMVLITQPDLEDFGPPGIGADWNGPPL